MTSRTPIFDMMDVAGTINDGRSGFCGLVGSELISRYFLHEKVPIARNESNKKYLSFIIQFLKLNTYAEVDSFWSGQGTVIHTNSTYTCTCRSIVRICSR